MAICRCGFDVDGCSWITPYSNGCSSDYSQASVVANCGGGTPPLSPASNDTCSLPSSGDHPVLSDCIQGSTVNLTGNLKVQGTTGSMRTIDRVGGGRHFLVGAGKTLTVEWVRLHNGIVSTDSCDIPYMACGGGGIVYVSGSGAVLHLLDAWLSGGSSLCRRCYIRLWRRPHVPESDFDLSQLCICEYACLSLSPACVLLPRTTSYQKYALWCKVVGGRKASSQETLWTLWIYAFVRVFSLFPTAPHPHRSHTYTC